MTGVKHTKDNCIVYYKNEKLHREDGPAVIYPDGTKFYYKNGKLHREDGPAVIHPSGIKNYYLDDRELHINLIFSKSKKVRLK